MNLDRARMTTGTTARRSFSGGFAALCVVAALGAPASAAATDAAVLAAAQAEQPGVVESLKSMVAIESGSADGAGLAKMADYTEARLRALGAATERVAPAHGNAPLVKGVFSGIGSKRLMLIAHMDTVYPTGVLASQPYRHDGNRLYGPGIADDKGGIAVVLHALAVLKQLGWRDYAQLTVLFNADEEIGSGGSGELIATLADQHDYVFSCEPTGAKAVTKHEGLLLGASGAGTATLEVKGRASHAGGAPDQGRNALLELAYQMLQTKDVAKSVPGAQLNWTQAKGGLVRNQIPESAFGYADVRVNVAGADAKLKAALQEKLDSGKLVADTTTTLKLDIARPPFVANERARAFAQQAKTIYAELDGRVLVLVPMSGGATDAAFAGRSGKAIVLESVGLAGWGYHARDEYIEIDSIVPRLYLLVRMLQTAARS